MRRVLVALVLLASPAVADDGTIADTEEDGIVHLIFDAGTLSRGDTSYSQLSLSFDATVERPPAIKVAINLQDGGPGSGCRLALIADGRKLAVIGKPRQYGGEAHTDMGGFLYHTEVMMISRRELARLARARSIQGSFCADHRFTLRRGQRAQLRAFARALDARLTAD